MLDESSNFNGLVFYSLAKSSEFVSSLASCFCCLSVALFSELTKLLEVSIESVDSIDDLM